MSKENNSGNKRIRMLFQFHPEYESTLDSLGGMSDTWIPFYQDNDVAESGTTTTNIKMTAHGLSNGDYIVNNTRSNAVREVAVVDVDNITVSSVVGQTTGDTIYKHSVSKSKIWINITPYRGVIRDKKYVDDHKRSEITHKGITRYRSDLNSKLRGKLGSRIFEIINIININEINKYYEISFKEERA